MSTLYHVSFVRVFCGITMAFYVLLSDVPQLQKKSVIIKICPASAFHLLLLADVNTTIKINVASCIHELFEDQNLN